MTSPAACTALRRAGSPEFSDADLTLLLEQFEQDRIGEHVERMILDRVQTALSALKCPSLDPEGVAQLRRVAHHIAWRER